MGLDEQSALWGREQDRIADALEAIGDALTQWVKLEQQRFEKEYPVKPDVRDAHITNLPTEEDLLREDQTGEPEPLEEWIGLREQAIIENPPESPKARKEQKRDRSKKAQRNRRTTRSRP